MRIWHVSGCYWVTRLLSLYVNSLMYLIQVNSFMVISKFSHSKISTSTLIPRRRLNPALSCESTVHVSQLRSKAQVPAFSPCVKRRALAAAKFSFQPAKECNVCMFSCYNDPCQIRHLLIPWTESARDQFYLYQYSQIVLCCWLLETYSGS